MSIMSAPQNKSIADEMKMKFQEKLLAMETENMIGSLEHKPICSFFQRGLCRFPNNCNNSHYSITKEKQVVCILCNKKMDNKTIRNHAEECVEYIAIKQERKTSTDVLCVICQDVIYQKKGDKFGLMSNCTHAFCLKCIRDWRNQQKVCCPICRVPSDSVDGQNLQSYLLSYLTVRIYNRI
eukprot:432649_1